MEPAPLARGAARLAPVPPAPRARAVPRAPDRDAPIPLPGGSARRRREGSAGAGAAAAAALLAGGAAAAGRSSGRRRRAGCRAAAVQRRAAARAAAAPRAPRLGRLSVEGGRFLDERGRVALPRGISFSGLSKVPSSPEGATHIGGQLFYEHRSVSFVGRPCPLGELDAHLARISSWGLTLMRLIVTWEAVEHGGPGEYDEEYLDYIREVCLRAGAFGITVFIDPHQDCWSRWTGGDGAPGWTLEAAGLEVAPALHRSGASFLHQENGDPLPAMSWPSNYDRLGCATMTTLFWAGDRVAPGARPRLGSAGSLQRLLQGSFIRAMAAVARRLRGVPSVVGFETLNEPHPGWLGAPDVREALAGPITTGVSPLDQMRRCAEGGAWAEGRCLWAEAGVWRQSTGEALDPRRFRCDDWLGECFAPFVERYAAAIRAELPEALVVVCPPAFGAESRKPMPGPLPAGAVWAPHFYDGVVLVGKVWNPDFGIEETPEGARVLGGLLPAPGVLPVLGGVGARVEAYKRQLRWKGELGGAAAPVLIGEVGVPFDLAGEEGLRAGDLQAPRGAVDATLSALEQLFLPFCWWNYTPENSHGRGDGWNGENLSIFCAEGGGGRCLEALVRPGLLLCAGRPVAQSFDLERRSYRCEFEADGEGESVFFVPSLHFPRDATSVAASPTSDVAWDEQTQSISYRAAAAGRCVLELRRRASGEAPGLAA